MNRKHILGYAATAIVALGIGSSVGSSSSVDAASTAAAPATTVTATSTVPGPTSTVPGPTVTVPGPTVTVTSPKPAKTVTVKVTPTPEVAFPGDGTYEVGADVKPGTYVSKAPDGGNCYWARLSGGDGLDNIIANNNSSGQSVVTIKESDSLFETSGCSDWSRR